MGSALRPARSSPYRCLAGRPSVRAAKRNQDGARVPEPPRRKWKPFRPGRFLPLDRPGLIGVRRLHESQVECLLLLAEMMSRVHPLTFVNLAFTFFLWDQLFEPRWPKCSSPKL